SNTTHIQNRLDTGGFCLAFTVLSYQFLGATPDHWCHIQPLVEANWTQQQVLSFAIPYSNETGRYSGCQMYDYNYTVAATLGYEASINTSFEVVSRGSSDIVACHERDFNHTQYRSTVVTKWDLVCERRALYSTIQAATQLGLLLSSFVSGCLMDQCGRRPVVLGCLVVNVALGFLGLLSPTPYVFIAFRLALSITGFAVYLGNFLICEHMMEVSSSSTRSTFGGLFLMMWAAGYFVLPGVAYLVRDWQWLQAALNLPNVVMLLEFWLLPESPRWLILQNRDLEAVEVLTQAAK
ncbi:Organic cation transporter protein-like 16, partial [Homarus americanus]